VGNTTIGSGDTFRASNSAALTLGDDFTVSGTFTHNNGTVVFNTSATSTITGTTSFYNFVSTTAGKPLRFGANQTFTIAGTLTLTGTTGNEITLDRFGGSGSDRFTFSVTATQTVDGVDVAN